MAFDEVLVGVDGGGGGRDAIALALELLAPGGMLTLGHVYDRERTLDWSTDWVEDRTRNRHAVVALGELRAELKLDATVLVIDAKTVAEGLHRLARIGHSDIIVAGSCHRHGLGRLLVGDDAAQLLRDAPCPVAIAPAGYAAEAGLAGNAEAPLRKGADARARPGS